jgi:long-chain acyl-CoA synthetase
MVHPVSRDELTPLCFLERSARVFPARTALVYGAECWTWERFAVEVGRFAGALRRAGVEPGDRVAVLAPNVPVMLAAHFAVLRVRAALVAINTRLAPDEVAYILGHSGAKVALVDPELASRVRPTRAPGIPGPLWVNLEDAVAGVAGSPLDGPSFAEFVDGAEVLAVTGGVDDEERVTSINYTSGTTGRPKGCELTHGNFLAELDGALEELAPLFEDDDATTLLFLPLAHVFARVIQIGCLRAGVRLGHSADIAHLLDDLAVLRPTFVLAVPRVFEKIFNTASQRAAADGRGGTFDRAAETAVAYSRGLDRGRPSTRVRARHAIFERLVYRRLREALGGRCAYAVSGGAPLGERLGHFYRGIGVTVLEGYGLTETTAAVTVNRVDALKVGSVGQPLPGVTVRVADDGELLFRGGQVFAGYWQNPEATADAIDAEGWLHTGDLGEVDAEGFVRVTGRKKEIIVTAGGKNVAPAVLEDRLRAHSLVSQCLVVGDGRPFIAALVTIDPDVFAHWAERLGKTGTVADHVDDPDLRAAVEEAVGEANKAVSKAESIRKFAILDVDWTEESGELTPSLKLKRNVVMRAFKDDIAALYLP